MELNIKQKAVSLFYVYPSPDQEILIGKVVYPGPDGKGLCYFGFQCPNCDEWHPACRLAPLLFGLRTAPHEDPELELSLIHFVTENSNNEDNFPMDGNATND